MRVIYLPFVFVSFLSFLFCSVKEPAKAVQTNIPVEEITLITTLQEIADSISHYKTQHVKENPDDPDTAMAAYIVDWVMDESNEFVSVGLSICTDMTINLFRKQVMDSPFIRFHKTSPRIPIKSHHTAKYISDIPLGYRIELSDTLFSLPMPEKFVVTLFNDTDINSMTGVYYWIDYNNNGTWEVIEFTPNDGSVSVFVDIGISLPAHGKEEYITQFHPEWYRYQPGEYRVRKPFHMDGKFKMQGQARIWEDYQLIAYFRIE